MKKFYSLLFLTLFCASAANAMEERPIKKIKLEEETSIAFDEFALTIQKNWRGHKVRRDVANQVLNEFLTKCFKEFLDGHLDIKEIGTRLKKIPEPLLPYLCIKFLMLVFTNIKSNLPEGRIPVDVLTDLFAIISALFNGQQTYLLRLIKAELFEGPRNKDFQNVAREAYIIFKNIKRAEDTLKADPSASVEHKVVLEQNLEKLPRLLQELHDKSSSETIKSAIAPLKDSIPNMVGGYKLLINASKIPGFNFLMSKKFSTDIDRGFVQELMVNYLEGKNRLFDSVGRDELSIIIDRLNNPQGLLQRLVSV